eukprot:TRINITY_DN4114_c0_g1_i1.p1 TRINITY_DN4114_c0_g1~~TRINITY_DN4114_c0_g1_i1.p1  ORF type:complete len:678 (+),score=189.18 TRINITY_DN4114_c0_g1_i1:51-2084(+)
METAESRKIHEERQKISFNVRQLTYLLDGGEKITALKEQIAKEIEQDPILNEGLKRYDLTHDEGRELGVKKFIRAWTLMRDRNELSKKIFYEVLETFDRSVGMRLFIHQSLFINNILTQGTKEQRDKWLPKAHDLSTICCFGMTELGHSSFLRGLETIAHYDPATQEFEINSTALTATKIWIGLAGQIATHCILIAGLVLGQGTNKQDCGIQLFIVPLRDPLTGRPYQGISIGDMGKKAGRNSLDNGWISFKQVRVPRENMLMRWAQVSPDGTFSTPPNAALVYGATVTERVASLIGAYTALEHAVTIGLRYSVVRTQGPQNQYIIDYQTQQQRLFPLIAGIYAIKFTYQKLSNQFETLNQRLEKGDEGYFLSQLPDVHANACAQKAYCTWFAADGLETVRRAMGGIAYLSLSGIPALIGDFGVVTTGGGDNVVIAQQTAKYLLKSFQILANSGVHPDEDSSKSSLFYFAHYFKQLNTNKKFPPHSVEEILKLPTEAYLDAFCFTSMQQLAHTAQSVQSSLKSGASFDQAWNDNLLRLVDCALMHASVYVLKAFLDKVESVNDLSLKKPLETLFHLFALVNMERFITQFLTTGYIDGAQVELIKRAQEALYAEVRKDCVGLVDAFNHPDFILNTPLGRKDGNIYPHILEAMKSTKNSTKIAPFWKTVFKPLRTSSKL